MKRPFSATVWAEGDWYYLDEQAYRLNNRKLTDSERFEQAMHNINGKRVTWDQVTGKDGSRATWLN